MSLQSAMDLFTRVFNRMYAEVREKLEAFVIRESPIVFIGVDSLEVGPRDQRESQEVAQA